jgi:Protein of unknown function, DUF618.
VNYALNSVSCPGVNTKHIVEVTQQSKARHKDDFLNAFSPYIADATALAYKGAPPDIQAKLRRVLDVWKERCIFDRDILQDIEAKFAGESDSSHSNYKQCADFGQKLIAAVPKPPSEVASAVRLPLSPPNSSLLLLPSWPSLRACSPLKRPSLMLTPSTTSSPIRPPTRPLPFPSRPPVSTAC